VCPVGWYSYRIKVAVGDVFDVPVITGGKQPRDHAYYFNHAGTHAVIKGDYKVVREGRGPWKLYNLAEDRTETRNLAKQYPQRVEELTAL